MEEEDDDDDDDDDDEPLAAVELELEMADETGEASLEIGAKLGKSSLSAIVDWLIMLVHFQEQYRGGK